MLFIIALSLSSLLALAGLYLLSRSKKENLGNLFHFSAYSAIILGLLLFFGSIVAGSMRMMHCKSGHGQSMCMPMQKGHGMSMCGSSCTMSMKGMHGRAGIGHGHHGMKGKCGMASGHHSMQGGMHSGMHKMCSAKCENAENCECPHCPHKEGKKIRKEVIIEELESAE